MSKLLLCPIECICVHVSLFVVHFINFSAAHKFSVFVEFTSIICPIEWHFDCNLIRVSYKFEHEIKSHREPVALAAKPVPILFQRLHLCYIRVISCQLLVCRSTCAIRAIFGTELIFHIVLHGVSKVDQ